VRRIAKQIALSTLLIVGPDHAHGVEQPDHARDGISTMDATTIRLYKGETLGSENFCTITISTHPYIETVYFGSGKTCGKNDHASSMKLHNMPAGSIITVYDNPKCGDHDDWQSTTVTRLDPVAPDMAINSFELSGEQWNFTIDGQGGAVIGLPDPIGSATKRSAWVLNYHEVNGLKGKVSCMTVYVP